MRILMLVLGGVGGCRLETRAAAMREFEAVLCALRSIVEAEVSARAGGPSEYPPLLVFPARRAQIIDCVCAHSRALSYY